MTILSPGHIRLSGERKAQLEEIADLTGATSLSAAIGKLIEFARDQGLITHTIPGVTINSLGDGLAVAFDGDAPTGFSHEGVAKLVSTIREYVNADAATKITVNVDHNFSVGRRGTSFKVAIPVTSENVKTWAADIALEFADIVEAESAKALAA